MSDRVNLMSLWKEFNPGADRSIRDDFRHHGYTYTQKIADYLDCGTVLLVSPECGRDVITEERITGTLCLLTDGEYCWENTLSHYVRKYYLQLPTDFELKVLTDLSSEARHADCFGEAMPDEEMAEFMPKGAKERMKKSEKICENLYGLELFRGKLELIQGHGFSCFFIVQHFAEEEYIKKQIIQLALAGCSRFVFLGEQSRIWCKMIEESDKLLSGAEARKILVRKAETVQQFTEMLKAEQLLKPFVPQDYYLIYDDVAIYNEVREKVLG